jgi:hypothetical protein
MDLRINLILLNSINRTTFEMGSFFITLRKPIFEKHAVFTLLRLTCPMTIEEFKTTLQATTPENSWNSLLRALWYDKKGSWEEAHNIAQDVHTKDGSWIHAYLHRKEGDNGNAGYWYHRAGKKMPTNSLDDEWTQLVKHFLAAE